MASETPARAVHWLARGEHELPSSDDWLTDAEAARASATRLAKRRTEYLLRRWVCKQAVASVAGLPHEHASLARIEVANRPSGAPVVSIDGDGTRFDVSLSDRAGWAVCVLGESVGRLGCDLELVEPRTPGFVDDFLTPHEQAYVAAQPTPRRDLVTNLIWSAKESALKVLQTGLRLDTREVEVVLGRGDATAAWSGLEVDTATGGRFPGRWRRVGSFVLTVVSENSLAEPVALASSGDLEDARPVHSWVEHPLSE
ncbi:MAG: 4'-phosphopantetheinyl transferase superfamily protein [Nocardioides sp.]